MLDVGQEGPLGEYVDVGGAHRADDLRIWDGLRGANAQSKKRLGFRSKRKLQALRLRPFRCLIPPESEKSDLTHLATNPFKGRQQFLGNVLPSPPVMADVQDVIDLGRRR